MAAAHEGVPVANLPGGWNGGGGVLDTVADILRGDGGQPAAMPVDHTASVDRPVPPGNVGEPSRRVGSIMDIIMGN